MRPEKQQLVEDIRQLIEPSPAVFVVTYKGLNSAQFTRVRNELAEQGAQFHVVPNRLLKRAAYECGITALAGYSLEGDSAVIIGGSEVVRVAKKVRDFAKETQDVMSIKCGFLGGKALNAEEVKQLADLPSREVLLAQLLGVLNAPARNLVGVLYAKKASIVYALNAYLNQKENAA